MYMTCGRATDTRTGCAQAGIIVRQVMEAVITELFDADAGRVREPEVGFKLQQPVDLKRSASRSIHGESRRVGTAHHLDFPWQMRGSANRMVMLKASVIVCIQHSAFEIISG